MPFVNLRWPSLGPSLLQAALARREIDCDQAYLNFDFADRVGLETYQWLADKFAFVAGGERLFARHYFDNLPDDESYYREVLTVADADLPREDFAEYLRIGEQVGPFLDDCEQAIDWSQYAIVGFSASFQQTMASLCLARRIKRRYPGVKILFGGAACEGELGVEMLRSFADIDYVFLGEADDSLPELVLQLFSGAPVRIPAGVVGRQPVGEREANLACAVQPAVELAPLYRDLNRLPYPDFDDYFARLRRSPFAAELNPILMFETSRGCWWGQKHHCKFCGLNGGRITYRRKDPQRAIDELRYLSARHGVSQGCSADNILDFRYFESFLPLLREAGLGMSFVFEMKTNLSRAQVQTLLDAGVGAAQLGIETFSTPILKGMDKGATGIQNLQTLKWFSEAGVEAEWNLLYGFPQEDPCEYRALAELLPSLVHLVPPLALGRVRADRFSPYFENPAAHGLCNLRPHRAFRFVFPFPGETVARLAYYYEHDFADGRDVRDYVGPLLEAAAAWQELRGIVTLRYWDRDDGTLIVTDTRPCATAFQHRLTDWQRELYLFCDTGHPLSRILERLRETIAAMPSEAAVRGCLEQWVAARLMVHRDDRYLSLAMRAPSGMTPG
jgi:ribosomal peptide maturation radical SAM protein 1